jgi:hypothetical protein
VKRTQRQDVRRCGHLCCSVGVCDQGWGMQLVRSGVQEPRAVAGVVVGWLRA